jgi:hypothetical protein
LKAAPQQPTYRYGSLLPIKMSCRLNIKRSYVPVFCNVFFYFILYLQTVKDSPNSVLKKFIDHCHIDELLVGNLFSFSHVLLLRKWKCYIFG